MRIDRAKLCGELARRCWTLKKLSESTGISRQTLSYIKHGKSCTDRIGMKIAEALNAEPEELIEK